MTEKEYESHHQLILTLKGSTLLLEPNYNLTAMPCKECTLNFQQQFVAKNLDKPAVFQ